MWDDHSSSNGPNLQRQSDLLQAYRDRAGHEDPRVPFGLKHFRSPRYQEGSVNSVHLLGREEKILEGKLARRTVCFTSLNQQVFRFSKEVKRPIHDD